MKLKISNKQLRDCLEIEKIDFPKYVAPIINLANQFAQGTRPKIVGQMSNLIQEFTGRTWQEWERWYQEKNPRAIENATARILEKIREFEQTFDKIDHKIVESWVKDLVILKTFIGLRAQEAILKSCAEQLGVTCRLSTPTEESQGIDGFIGDVPVSIKPESYRSKSALPENIKVKLIYYTKVKDGLEVDLSSFSVQE